MESEQFTSLGDRVDFKILDKDDSSPTTKNQYAMNIARQLTYILFEEIIESSPTQSRTVVFDPVSCQEDKELLESVQKHGIITPIIVRELKKEGHIDDPFLMKNPGERTFALVAGHRRVAAGRAAGLAGTEGVIAKSTEDHDLITLVENLGRRELTTYEKALAYKSLQERRGLSGNKTAQLIGISQGSINRMFNALKSPTALRELWQDGYLSDTAIVILKEHWEEIDQFEIAYIKDKLRGLARSGAVSLRDQLGSGTPLDTVLVSMDSINDSPTHLMSPKPTKQSCAIVGTKEKQISRENHSSEQKYALISAINDVFPKISKEKGKVLFDYTVVNGISDIDVLWAAALYVAKGGKLDEAIALSAKVMSNRKITGLINRQIKQAKQAASLYKKYWGKNLDIKQYLKTVFR